jgi:hypothetical protein
MIIDFSKIYLFTWEDLYLSELENEIGIEAFKKLNVNQEQSLIITQKEFKETIEKELKTLPEEEQGNYYMQIFQREELMIKELLRQQRYSLCLSVFSFLEGRLKAICKQVEDMFQFKIKVADLNSNEDITKYWNYLVKVFELDPSNTEPFLTPIKQQKIVRNLIAHQNGMPSKEQEKKIVITKGLELEKFDDIDYCKVLISDPIFIDNLLGKMDGFLKQLLLDIDARYIEITAK